MLLGPAKSAQCGTVCGTRPLRRDTECYQPLPRFGRRQITWVIGITFVGLLLFCKIIKKIFVRKKKIIIFAELSAKEFLIYCITKK